MSEGNIIPKYTIHYMGKKAKISFSLQAYGAEDMSDLINLILNSSSLKLTKIEKHEPTNTK